MKLGFLVNPLAGYGIGSNMKGSDGLVMESYDESRSVSKAMFFLEGIKSIGIEFYVPAGIMGSDLLERVGISSYTVIYTPGEKTTSDDTKSFVRELNNTDAELLAFVGGDGTARDILSEAGDQFSIIGIPAGIKMYSSVFSISVMSSVRLIKDLCESGSWETMRCEVVDLDESKFREGKLDISLYGEMKVPRTPHIVSQSKAEYSHVDVSGVSEYVQEKMIDGTCYIIGPGSTCKSVLPESIGKTNMLGFDIIKNGELVKNDVDEGTIFSYASTGPAVIIISPIGGQNFLLGRGNKQVSERIVETVGWDNIWVISSMEKLGQMGNLYVDINNSPDTKIPNFIKVLYGYGRYRMIQVKR